MTDFGLAAFALVIPLWCESVGGITMTYRLRSYIARVLPGRFIYNSANDPAKSRLYPYRLQSWSVRSRSDGCQHDKREV
jgi:hypothetical protein